MTCIDGSAMARKGRAGAALCIAAVGSFVAGTFGVIMLTLVAPPLATIALRFGPPEYTALIVLGLIFLAYMSSTSLIRTLLMAALGLMFGMIGIDNMTGHFRYSFDLPELGDGIGIVPVAVGLFGLGEILSTPSHKVTGEVIAPEIPRAAADPSGVARGRLADRARQRARLHHRHHSGLGAHHFELPVLCAGEAHLQASRTVRQGRGGRRGRAGIGQQLGLHRRIRADAGARHPDRPDHGGADRRPDDPWRVGRAADGDRTPRRVLGLRRLDVCRQPGAAGAQPAAGQRCSSACCGSPTRISIRSSSCSASSACTRSRTRSSTSGSC